MLHLFFLLPPVNYKSWRRGKWQLSSFSSIFPFFISQRKKNATEGHIPFNRTVAFFLFTRLLFLMNDEKGRERKIYRTIKHAHWNRKKGCVRSFDYSLQFFLLLLLNCQLAVLSSESCHFKLMTDGLRQPPQILKKYVLLCLINFLFWLLFFFLFCLKKQKLCELRSALLWNNMACLSTTTHELWWWYLLTWRTKTIFKFPAFSLPFRWISLITKNVFHELS